MAYEAQGIKPSTKDRITVAALELFVEQGYFNTNIPDISKRSRCSVGSIYHHFLNKEEIGYVLYSKGIAEFRAVLSEAIDSKAHPETNIHSLVTTFLRFAQTKEILSRYLWLTHHREFLSNNVRRPTVVGFDLLGRRLTTMVKDGIRNGYMRPIEAEVLWSILFGIPLSFVRDWLEGYTKKTPEEVATVLGISCWDALRAQV